jgi:HSP20 family protein
MELARWNPFRELEDMQGRLNRLFGEPSFARTGENGMSFSGWSPAVDVQETDKEYLIKADLPDVKKEDVKVELLDGTLTIEGERQQEKEEKGKTFHKIEREYGKFLRRFAMPSEVDASKVQADFKNGVLNVHLPKSATAKPKAIDVKVS